MLKGALIGLISLIALQGSHQTHAEEGMNIHQRPVDPSKVDKPKLPFELKFPNVDFSKTKIEEVALSGGFKAWLVANNDIPVISINILIKDAGFKTDPDNKKGLERIYLAMTDEGAGELGSQQFKSFLKEQNILFNALDTVDTVSFNFKFPKSSLDQAFKAIDMILNQLRFDISELNRVKDQLKVTYKQALESEAEIVNERMLEAFFSGTPYGPSLANRLAHIDSITSDDLKNYCKNHITQDHLIVSVCGDISAKDLTDKLSPIFAKLPEKSSYKDMDTLEAKNLGKRFDIAIDIPQTVILAAHPTLKRNHPDYYKLDLVMEIFGGSDIGTRLMKAIRVKKGLAYGAFAYPLMSEHAPLLFITSSTRTETTEDVVTLIEKEWKELIDKGITEAELEQAKRSKILSAVMRLQDTSSIASILSAIQYHDLGKDFLLKRQETISKITLEEVNEAIKKHYSHEKLTLFIGGRHKAKVAAA